MTGREFPLSADQARAMPAGTILWSAAGQVLQLRVESGLWYAVGAPWPLNPSDLDALAPFVPLIPDRFVARRQPAQSLQEKLLNEPASVLQACPVCGKRVRVRANGVLWTHNDDNQPKLSGLPFGIRCEGTYDPLEVVRAAQAANRNVAGDPAWFGGSA